MPIYEYECGACGHAFERLESMSEPTVHKCPECGRKKATRQMSTFAGMVKSETPSCGDRGAACRGSDSVCASGRCPMSGA